MKRLGLYCLVWSRFAYSAHSLDEVWTNGWALHTHRTKLLFIVSLRPTQGDIQEIIVHLNNIALNSTYVSINNADVNSMKCCLSGLGPRW